MILYSTLYQSYISWSSWGLGLVVLRDVHRQSAELPRKTLLASVPVSKDNTPRLSLHGSPRSRSLSLSRPVSSHISCSRTFSTRDGVVWGSEGKTAHTSRRSKTPSAAGGFRLGVDLLEVSIMLPSLGQRLVAKGLPGLVLHRLAVGELRHRRTMGSVGVIGRHLTSHLQIHFLPPLWQE